MSPEDDPKPAGPGGPTMWVLGGVAALVAGFAVVTYAATDERQAASGVVLYDKAVKEALRGLRSAGKPKGQAGGRPALPEGLSPEDHYWCENCKAWHKKQAGAAPHSPDSAPPVRRAYVPYALGKAPADLRAAATPRPANNPRPAASQPRPRPQRAVVPYALGLAPGDPQAVGANPPPLPAEYSPKDYYWCEKCKGYHKRPEAKAAERSADPPVGTP